MPDLILYADPAGARYELTLDNGTVLQGTPCFANGRPDAHSFPLAADTPVQGVTVHCTCDEYVPTTLRGILVLDDPLVPMIAWDDLKLVRIDSLVAPTPPIPAYPTGTPEEIINAVYASGAHDLSTHDGCGLFTEACCDALHASNAQWGHVRKNPGQNQFNGHAIDAVYLLAGPGVGVYDIIHDSVSPTATPSCNWKDPGDPSLWYYPA